MDQANKIKLLNDITDCNWKQELLKFQKQSYTLLSVTNKKKSYDLLNATNKSKYVLSYILQDLQINKKQYLQSIFYSFLLTIAILIFKGLDDSLPIDPMEFIEFAMYATFFIYYFFFKSKTAKNLNILVPSNFIVSDQDLLLFFNSKVKKNIDKKIHQSFTTIEDSDSVLQTIKDQIKILEDQGSIQELNNQIQDIKLNKIENLRLQSLFNQVEQTFKSDEEKVKILKVFLN